MTSTSYTKLPHDKLKSNLTCIVILLLKRGEKTFTRLSNNRAACWKKKTKGGLGFSSKTSLKTAVNPLGAIQK